MAVLYAPPVVCADVAALEQGPKTLHTVRACPVLADVLAKRMSNGLMVVVSTETLLAGVGIGIEGSARLDVGLDRRMERVLVHLVDREGADLTIALA